MRRAFKYDALQRRVWVFGQRCHHGATGTLLASVACLGLVTQPLARRTHSVVVLLTGGVLMAHDWKDRAQWFARGYGSPD